MESHSVSDGGQTLAMSSRRRMAVTAGVLLGMFLAALEATIVGIAVPTMVASSAARNIPSSTPAVTAVRRREDIASVCPPSDTE